VTCDMAQEHKVTVPLHGAIPLAHPLAQVSVRW